MSLFGKPKRPRDQFQEPQAYPRQLSVPDLILGSRHAASTTDYEKVVNPAKKGSWDKHYVPSQKKLLKRVVNRHETIGTTTGGVGGMLAGAGLGSGIGAYLGSRGGGHLLPLGVQLGGIAGGLAGAIGGSYLGNRLGAKRGKKIASQIPSEPGSVKDFTSKHPILGRLYFSKKSDLKKHKKIPYNQDYRAKDIDVYNNKHFGPQIRVSAGRDVRKHASIKTGFAKRGYYREDELTRDALIEAIVEATFTDVMTVPKNEYEMKKLANRSTLGHVGHGVLRYFGGGQLLGTPVLAATGSTELTKPFAFAGAIGNTLRYFEKVKNAKQGKHREQDMYMARGSMA